jgi:hypothetical protein
LGLNNADDFNANIFLFSRAEFEQILIFCHTIINDLCYFCSQWLTLKCHDYVVSPSSNSSFSEPPHFEKHETSGYVRSWSKLENIKKCIIPLSIFQKKKK